MPASRATGACPRRCNGTTCAVFGQLDHSGIYAAVTDDGSIGVAYGPSQAKAARSHNISRAMSKAMIRETVGAYGAAAGRMKRAGLDGVEILASHGLLPAQFLSPRINRRTDEYGGSFENRRRFINEVITSVREDGRHRYRRRRAHLRATSSKSRAPTPTS